MRKCRILCAVAFIALILPVLVTAHSGMLDSNGGHHSSTGYHYHHGYPAHSHYDMDRDGVADCPYDFDDKTGQNSGSSGASSNSSSQKPQSNSNSSGKTSTSEEFTTTNPLLLVAYVGFILLILYEFLPERNVSHKAKKRTERKQSNHQEGLHLSKNINVPKNIPPPTDGHNAAKLNSSFLASVEYVDSILYLTFKDGRKYAYYQVPQEVYNDLISAQSPGKYFHENIQNIYPFM